MKPNRVEVRVEGKTHWVPAASIAGRTLIATGRWVKTATVMDEDIFEGEPLADPDLAIAEMKRQGLKADLLSFSQTLLETRPKHPYVMEWDNAAVIPTRDYADWWEKRLSQDTRRNVRRAAKMGVTTRVVDFDDELVRGIVEIYNETDVRQGRRFWHYGKGFEVVRKEAGTHPDRSLFIGAYLEGKLIGFIKLTFANQCGHIIFILSKVEHADKRPTNALIAKAVEVCAERGMAYLTYCKYVYGKNDNSPLTEFKRRNGFEKLQYPRYHVPLTLKGRLVLKFNLHHGLKNLLPKRVVEFLLWTRARFFELARRKPGVAAEAVS
jgi:hypothetical protein